MPHTKQQLLELLGGAGTEPRHKWGQNFLIDLNLMRLLVEQANLTGRETVLEVGTGTGSLTSLLAEQAGQVITVEIDGQLAQIARDELAKCENVTIIEADVLSRKSQIAGEVLDELTAACEATKGEFYLIANLPYQVASPLIINLLLGELTFAGMFVTVQAEVALRMAGTPGTKEYGLLSILLQSTGEVKIFRKIKPMAFWPMPNVHSAMVSWRRDEVKQRKINDLATLKQVVDLLLHHRRKTIRSCLVKSGLEIDTEALARELEIDLHARGESLMPDDFVRLSNYLAAKQHG
ncbi:MAG: ribosomal RNA small subunit methyltransferase A [Sedimentisphaerales bacterium]|nr:ribosomal RNA small subunit methyltransferase A [Sedimentisphaerales bacterium]